MFSGVIDRCVNDVSFSAGRMKAFSTVFFSEGKSEWAAGLAFIKL